MTRRRTIWHLTQGEWNSLPVSKKMEYEGDPGGGPRPYHTNFHMLMVGKALRKGYPVPQRVINSYKDSPYIQREKLHLRRYGGKGG